MVSDNLLRYVHDEFSRGVDLGDLRKALLDEGWHVDEVEHALRSVRGHKPRFVIKNLRGRFFLLLLLVFVTMAVMFVLLSGSDRVVACGSDEDCFRESLSSCRPALYSGVLTLDGKYLVVEDFEFEVRGLAGDVCIVRYRMLDISKTYLVDPSVDVSDQEKLLRERVGLDAFCSVPLNRTKDFIYSGSASLFLDDYSCRGPLIEYFTDT